MSPVTIHYRKAFFGETTRVISGEAAKSGTPRGLVGRQVANAEMLSALLRHGTGNQIRFIVDGDRDAESLRALLDTELPADKQAVITPKASLDAWMLKPSRRVLWEPQPPTASLVWTRSRLARDTVAFAGVTHALCSAMAVAAIRDLVFAPTRNFDRLVCTSESVAHTARTLIHHFSGMMGKQSESETIQLETIPLGIDCDRHRPATSQERAAVRDRLGISSGDDVVLFVGRLSHHAKANPLPMYAACQRAAERNGRPVAMILAGWFASDAVARAFEGEARRVAPDVRLIHINAMDDQWRDSIWAAADIFVSLADSVQETFGLTVVEAMSRGLPVIASDWNGYRESIRHQETGLLVPTSMLSGAGEQALLEMHEGNLSYDHFLAAVGQTVCVSTAAACAALESLLASPEKRKSMADAGVRHARTNYDWSKIIPRYERLWAEQDGLMQHLVNRGTTSSVGRVVEHRPEKIVPSVRTLFERYPTVWIEPNETIEKGDGMLGDLDAICTSNLTNHAEAFRLAKDDAKRLDQRFHDNESAVESLQNLQSENAFDDHSVGKSKLADTLAWMMKFDLLRRSLPIDVSANQKPRIDVRAKPDITFTTTCMGRLAQLRRTLPRMVEQPGCHVVVVDYSCPDRSGKWVSENFSSEQVTVVHLPGRKYFDRSEAKNAAILAATTPWICVIDADILVSDDFAQQIRHRLGPDRFLRRISTNHGIGGTFIASRETVLQVGMHDPVFKDWGEEDSDLLDALRHVGNQPTAFPEELISHLKHDNEMRTQFHETQDRRVSHLTNRIYRAAKWDLIRLTTNLPSMEDRQELYQSIRQHVTKAIADRSSTSITLPVGKTHWKLLSATGSRSLTYRVEIDKDF